MIALRQAAKGGVPSRPREYYLSAGREYVRRYGADQLTSAAFAPAAAKRGGRPDLVERYYAGRLDGTPWPSLNALKRNFDGSFNTFRKELGLEPNKTLPVRGRRKPGESVPILEVRERRVIVESGAEVSYLRREVQAARRRADRAERLLEEAKVKEEKARQVERVEVRVENTEKIKDLRNRLADEKSRRRRLERDLKSAEKREKDLRARPKERVRVQTLTKTRTVEVEDPSAMAEIQRLTERLARSHDRAEDLRRERDAALARIEDALESGRNVRREAADRAAVDSRVAAAERKVRAAEERLAEMGELVTGTRRKLTREEVQTIRKAGPAGAGPFAVAAKKALYAAAKGERLEQITALTRVQETAQAWKDVLR